MKIESERPIFRRVASVNTFYVCIHKKLNNYNKFKPWKLKTYIAFSDAKKAEEFEKFLKTGNGRLFIKKRL